MARHDVCLPGSGMAVSTEDITTTLDGMSWTYKVKEESGHVLTGVATDVHIDKDGDHHLGLVLHTSEDGELLIVAAPWVRTLRNISDAQRLALFDVFNDAALQFKLVRPYWSPSSGELTVRIQVPFEEGEFHSSILERCISDIIEFFEVYGPRMDEAIDSAEAILIEVPGEEETITMTRAEMMERFERYRKEQDEGA